MEPMEEVDVSMWFLITLHCSLSVLQALSRLSVPKGDALEQGVRGATD